jgi:hypothetical protein
VVVDRKVALLRCPASHAASLFGACTQAELELRDSVLVGHALTVTLPLGGVPSVDAALAGLTARVPGLEVTRAVGSLSLVGVGVGAEGNQIAAFMACLGAPALALVVSPLRVSAVLADGALADAERALHARFVAA